MVVPKISASPSSTFASVHSALPAELLLSAIVNSSDDAILSKSLDGTITSWNRGAELLFGFTAAEIVGQSVLVLIPPEQRHEELEILAKLQRGERIDHFESIRLRKDGSRFPVALTISPVKTPEGRIIGASKVARDLSSQREHVELRNLHAAIVESSDDGIISKDLNGTIMSWNGAATRIFGYTADEIIGRSVLMLIPPELHGDEAMILARLRQGERIDHFETTRLRKDGRRIAVSLTISPIRDGAGKLMGASKVVRDITPHREAELALRRLAAIVDSSEDAIIAKDLDGIITSWNVSAERMFGYASAEVIGKSVTILMQPEQAKEEPDILARIRRGERIEHHETIRRRKDGELFPVSLTISAIRDSSGKVVGASKIARDITAQRNAEAERAALLKKEQDARMELEAMIEASRGLTAELNLDATVQRATDTATKLSGAKFGAFFYNGIKDRQESWVVYASSGAPRAAFEKLGLAPNPAIYLPTFDGEGVVRLPDVAADPRYGNDSPIRGMPEGNFTVRSYLAVPVVSRGGEVLGEMFFGHPDVGVFTERAERIVVGIASQASIAIDNAKLYRTLENANARLSFSLSALELGDWHWDVATDEMQISARAAEIYGLPTGVGMTRDAMRMTVHPDDREHARKAALFATESGKDYEIEYRVNHPTAGERWVAAKGRPQVDENGRVIGMRGVVQDITDRKHVELALRESRAKLESHAQMLEHHVAERTAKLRETIGELEAFSYSISHDMRTPLRSMHGYADRLLRIYRDKLDDEAVHHLERISKNAQRLELLVRDVLAYSKVTQAEIQLVPVDLGPFFDALLSTVPELQRDDATIILQRPLPRVLAHEAYLSQVFTNLISNAVKFAAEGRRPEVEIRGSIEEGRALISVCDNGIGIAPAHFDRIFEIFGRVYSDKKFDGTGIGLSIVRKAVQRMGGQVSVQSTVGQGSCFSFTLKTA
ncbi:MAG: PAS domain S-box protein [Opitutaceae bacterium]